MVLQEFFIACFTKVRDRKVLHCSYLKSASCNWPKILLSVQLAKEEGREVLEISKKGLFEVVLKTVQGNQLENCTEIDLKLFRDSN